MDGSNKSWSTFVKLLAPVFSWVYAAKSLRLGAGLSPQFDPRNTATLIAVSSDPLL